MALSFVPGAPLCNPQAAGAVIPYGWPPASSGKDFDVAVRGAPGGLQEERQTELEEGGLCLSAREGWTKGERAQEGVGSLLGKRREGELTKPSHLR